MTIEQLKEYVVEQIKNIFLFTVNIETKDVEMACQKVDFALSKSCNRYIGNQSGGGINFSVFNTCQYSIFLYYLSNLVWKTDKSGINAEKIYYLNKTLNCVDIFYEINLPDIFYVEHPVGTVIGRGKIDNFFFVHQGCTVGENLGNFPTIGKNVTMFANSMILGNSKIGNNVIVAANTYIINETIPDNCIVFGQSPNLIIKKYDDAYIKNKLKRFWKY